MSYSGFMATKFDIAIAISVFFMLQLRRFTLMNVWMHYYYWADRYPRGPDDRICTSLPNKRNETTVLTHQFPDAPEISII